jgi:hypothetical protein
MEVLDAPGYELARWVVQRALGGVYLVAFLVAAHQFRPLAGVRGLLPMGPFLARVPFRAAPSLFHWTGPSDRAVAAAAWAGVALSALAFTGLSDAFGLAASITVWLALWALYLSFVNVGQLFYGYGWETLLLEAGFLAIFLGSSDVAPTWITIWLVRWLLFRVMFGAGLIKLRGDPCWRRLTCLEFHYETQPLPNLLSWYLHRSPRPVHRMGVLFTHFAQLVAAWGVLVAGPVGWAAGLVALGFQGMLILSGNLSWLNYLTLLLAFACFDDRVWDLALPAGSLGLPAVPGARPVGFDVAVLALALLVGVLSVRPVLNMVSPGQLMNASFEPLHLVNTYGAFGSVTRERYEVVLEGEAADGTWRAYGFKAKPGDPARRPPWVAPYHLRIDWQIWFSAMRQEVQERWLVRLAARLMEGDRPTLGLLRGNPFPDAPPRRVRARRFLYRFTTPAERRASGNWWHREETGTYLPPLSLDDLRAQGLAEG